MSNGMIIRIQQYGLIFIIAADKRHLDYSQ